MPPTKPATQAEECSSLHYTALLSPKSAGGDMAVLIHEGIIAITAISSFVSNFQFNPV